MRPAARAPGSSHFRRMLAEGRGTHFDPDILDVFVPLAPLLLREYAAAGESYLKGYLADFEGRYFS